MSEYTNDWQHGILGCFDNCGICLFSFLLPCYQAGKNAEAIGESCCIHAALMLVPVANCLCRYKQRSTIREQQIIDGTCCGDIAYIILCAPCSIAQEGQECEYFSPGSMALQ